MKTSDYHKVVMDVWIESYLVVEEAGADIIESLESGVCPMCSESASTPDFRVPEENEIVEWKCSECNIKITVESWLTK